MMRKNFQIYKNIILVVASALTLIAVTFAWFSTANRNSAEGLSSTVVNELIDVVFYEKSDATYNKMTGDIVLTNVTPNTYSTYRMDIETETSAPLKLSFGIDDLPADMNSDLADAVVVKYELYAATKSGSGDLIKGDLISNSIGTDGFVRLSDLTEGNIFTGTNLTTYQQSAHDYFIIDYQIGISAEATSTVSGVRSSLGSVRLNAVLAE